MSEKTLDSLVRDWLLHTFNLVVSDGMAQSVLDGLESADRSGCETEMRVVGRNAVTGIPQAILVISEGVRAMLARARLAS